VPAASEFDGLFVEIVPVTFTEPDTIELIVTVWKLELLPTRAVRNP
jgi:hypothetical protein